MKGFLYGTMHQQMCGFFHEPEKIATRHMLSCKTSKERGKVGQEQEQELEVQPNFNNSIE